MKDEISVQNNAPSVVRKDTDLKRESQELLTTRQWIYLLKSAKIGQEELDDIMCSVALEGSPIIYDRDVDSPHRWLIHFISNASYWDFVDKLNAIKERWNDIGNASS